MERISQGVSAYASLQKPWAMDTYIALFLRPDLHPRSRMTVFSILCFGIPTKAILLERCMVDPSLAVRLVERIGDYQTCEQVRLAMTRFPALLEMLKP